MDLTEKIRKVEALLLAAKGEGERQAALLAKQRLEAKLSSRELEYTIRLNHMWAKRLFTALCHKYQLMPYSYVKQKYTTSMVRVSESFMESVLWPEYKKYETMLQELVEEIMDGLISKIYKIAGDEETVISGELPVREEIAP